MNNQSRQALWLALAGSIVLMIGMGYGRFAFTGVLPLMLNEGLLTLHEGNLAASANYAGYLVGALLLARVQPGAATRLSIISAGLTIASLALLAWVSSPWTIITLRAVAGALSAITLIAGSLWLLTPPAALVRVSHVETSSPASGSDTRRAAWRLLMVYGLAGFGYIITATYLPLFLSGSLQSVDPVHLWALFGLAAAPSCLIWHKLVLKWGYRQALTRNLLVQALGVILPACSASLLFCVLSALLVGFTFMGTVTIALPKAKSLSHQVSFNMIAAMTALYGVGQIAGPLIAGALYQIAASFNPALYAAALALLIAAGLVFTERQA
ncbi:TPA: YbfB/YjiJ family MFS transporter [Klebsiella pneumoniae]|nr:YbfB/YjiJ family MFS transporter [Klebsiella pneumoniae]